jgi:transglutaminase-like putative cysteine protease
MRCWSPQLHTIVTRHYAAVSRNTHAWQVIAAGYASCTGLSIFLVAACRAVGIPARVAGTPSWVVGGRRADVSAAAVQQSASGSPGLGHSFNNHNWVEVWDDGRWSFIGAAEYDPAGVNRTW